MGNNISALVTADEARRNRMQQAGTVIGGIFDRRRISALLQKVAQDPAKIQQIIQNASSPEEAKEFIGMVNKFRDYQKNVLPETKDVSEFDPATGREITRTKNLETGGLGEPRITGLPTHAQVGVDAQGNSVRVRNTDPNLPAGTQPASVFTNKRTLDSRERIAGDRLTAANQKAEKEAREKQITARIAKDKWLLGNYGKMFLPKQSEYNDFDQPSEYERAVKNIYSKDSNLANASKAYIDAYNRQYGVSSNNPSGFESSDMWEEVTPGNGRQPQKPRNGRQPQKPPVRPNRPGRVTSTPKSPSPPQNYRRGKWLEPGPLVDFSDLKPVGDFIKTNAIPAAQTVNDMFINKPWEEYNRLLQMALETQRISREQLSR